ncbi:hypothetical protein [Vibrio neptunius]|nr:hypothetical protein [Vibrio neptunius]
MKIKPLFYSLTLLLIGCGSDPDSVPLSEIDHCDSIQQHQVEPLSHYLEPFQSKLDNATGVYVLEQGAEAMMSRAWITDRA